MSTDKNLFCHSDIEEGLFDLLLEFCLDFIHKDEIFDNLSFLIFRSLLFRKDNVSVEIGHKDVDHTIYDTDRDHDGRQDDIIERKGIRKHSEIWGVVVECIFCEVHTSEIKNYIFPLF